MNNPKTRALGLIVGVPTVNGPGDSATNISPILENQNHLKVEHQKIKKGHDGGGGDNFTAEFAKFNMNHPGFIISKEIGTVTVVSMQTPLMLVKSGSNDKDTTYNTSQGSATV